MVAIQIGSRKQINVSFYDGNVFVIRVEVIGGNHFDRLVLDYT